jgi:glycine cleavage system H lipoate-binding protein
LHAHTLGAVLSVLHCGLQVNTEPFTGGWMMKVKLTDASELDKLMDSAAYEKVIEDSAH